MKLEDSLQRTSDEAETDKKQESNEKPSNNSPDFMRAEKEAKLQAIINDIENWSDRLGERVDEGIKEAVAICNAMDFPTTASCEGEIDHGFPVPWIDVGAPNEPQERFENEREIYERTAKKYGIPIEAVLHADNEEAWREASRLSAENEETPEYKKWEKENEKLHARMEGLVLEFYKDRDVPEETRVIADREVGGFRLHNGGKYYIPSNFKERIESELTEEERKRIPEVLKSSQEEMRLFTEFLKKKYFEGSPNTK